jgi:hypothetical protein
LVLLVWILVGVFYFSLAYDYIRVTSNDDKLGEYLKDVVQIAAEQERPAKEIRQLVVEKAQQLDLPLHENQVAVAGSGQSLSVSIVYDVDIALPILSRGVYQKNFQHRATYKRPGT